MPRRVRVLVVDDSVVVRRAVSDMLSTDPLIEVVGTASNGKIALDRVVQQNPDLVVLDIEMPEMNGLEMLRQLRRVHPQLPVLVFSVLTEKGAMLTLDALALGARDYVTKPAHVGRHQVSLEQVRAELLEKTRTLGAYVHATPATPAIATPKDTRTTTPTLAAATRVEAVLIGASTGGPNAIAEILGAFPRDLRVPVFIVQHMPPVFTKIFAERLSRDTGLEVREAVPGELVESGHVWIAPGDFHMVLVRDGASVRVSTHRGPPENSCRPAVDVLFRSAAGCYGRNVLAVMLSGMGQDGLRGSEEVRRAGGHIIVQDEATSVVWSMPGCVARAGLAEAVLALSEIGPEVVRRVGSSMASMDTSAPSRRPG